LPETIEEMKDPKYIEMILRTNPDVIYSSPFVRTKKTAEIIQEIFRVHRQKDIPIILDEGLVAQSGKELASYTSILEKEVGKTVLLISHNPTFSVLWSHFYDTKHPPVLEKMGCLLMPTHIIANELDKWIISALHEVGMDVEKAMDAYLLDDGAKAVLGFIDKLNNWFIRRSRRRFWANGMDSDKYSAYYTLFEILQGYTKLCAPFAPFVSEHIYLALQAFTPNGLQQGDSVHLEHLPLSSEHYINHALLEEISLVRKIISLGLFIRSKNKIAVKQPLSTMEVKM